MEFKRYMKVAPTEMRILTEKDYMERHGRVQTLDGPRSFLPGDYLARQAKSEWPIQKTVVEHNYIYIAKKDREESFATYIRTGTVLATQIQEDFLIEGLHGKKGDYLVLSAGRGWPVDKELFEQAYKIYDIADQMR